MIELIGIISNYKVLNLKIELYGVNSSYPFWK